MAGKSKFTTYLKAAFKIPWHLLVLGAATIAGLLSGKPDVALPIVAAGEMVYLVGLAGNARFQGFIDGYAGKTSAAGTQALVQQRFEELYGGLDDRSRQAFDGLRARCLSVSELADSASRDALAAEQLAGIDKLLWVYLKLLHTRVRLERFFEVTNEKEIDRLLADAKQRIDALPAPSAANTIAEKKRKSLLDTLATADARKSNLKRARDNYDYVNLELQRIAAKLAGVVELAANRQDPAALTSEVDEAARSAEATEQMMGELQSFTGLTDADAEAPQILSGARRAAAAAASVKGRG